MVKLGGNALKGLSLMVLCLAAVSPERPVSSRAGYAQTFHRGFRPVGRRALRFIAFHEIAPSTPNIGPESQPSMRLATKAAVQFDISKHTRPVGRRALRIYMPHVAHVAF